MKYLIETFTRMYLTIIHKIDLFEASNKTARVVN